ncbi:MAG: hypothetical protein V4591_03910 [Bdellovibrionota bacterium]
MKVINNKDVTPEEELDYERLVKQDGKEWEEGNFGKNKKYMVRATPEEENKINEILEKKKTQRNYSIKMPEDMVVKLKVIASEKNIGYQTLIKIIASDYIQKNWKHSA